MSYCNNCGRISHCGEKIRENDEDGLTGEPYEWEVCGHCRCDDKKCSVKRDKQNVKRKKV